MVDKNYCMSSYLAFRYIADDEKDFAEGLHHENIKTVPPEKRIPVKTAKDIDREIGRQFTSLRDKKLGVMLSGGMDSAIVASYMRGCDAYTFRFFDGEFQSEELERSRRYAEHYGLHLHYVDITWKMVEKHIDRIMEAKAAPVHSIEPQICEAAEQAKADGVEVMLIGDGADYVFGGMDGLLSKDWTYDAFVERYLYIHPEAVLKNPVDMCYLFEPYRIGSKIDFERFMEIVATEESYGSYDNAFSVAGLPYLDPYASLVMAEPLDLNRVRNGEPKYLIRELFHIKYPDIPIPDKNPMPRPVDFYFKDWMGPKRSEFRKDLDVSLYTGNQKWQMWCLERFLNMIEDEA